jgi:hypothetical protein
MIVLGANALLLQVTSRREFMAVISGSELDLGIALSFWLLAVVPGNAWKERDARLFIFSADIIK